MCIRDSYYPGDLLVAVLRQPDTYWATHRIEADLLREALARLDPDDPDYPVDSDLTAVSYTHLDVYKRQAVTQHEKQKGRCRPKELVVAEDSPTQLLSLIHI